MSLPTVTDLKAHLNLTTSTHDDELVDILDAAIEVVEGIVGPIGSPAVVTETHYGVSSGVLVLRQMPVAALVSVSSRWGATTTALTLADYELDPATGLVRVASGGGFSGTYVVSYTTGLAALPAAIRLAVLELARHLWGSQRGGGSVRPAFPGEGDPDLASPSAGYLIPNRVRELLEPYMRPVIA